jgi:hypothetical protein
MCCTTTVREGEQEKKETESSERVTVKNQNFSRETRERNGKKERQEEK